MDFGLVRRANTRLLALRVWVYGEAAETLIILQELLLLVGVPLPLPGWELLGWQTPALVCSYLLLLTTDIRLRMSASYSPLSMIRRSFSGRFLHILLLPKRTSSRASEA